MIFIKVPLKYPLENLTTYFSILETLDNYSQMSREKEVKSTITSLIITEKKEDKGIIKRLLNLYVVLFQIIY